MIDLNGIWKLKNQKETMELEAGVPGTVYTAMLEKNLIVDPFYGENEEQVKALSDDDYEYSREFQVDAETLAQDRLVLVCEGVDTLGDIYVNQRWIGSVKNMHRRYEFEVKDVLVEGTNEIRVALHSPIAYITKKQEEKELWGVDTTIAGFPHIRKAHHMFGWDWGPQLPDLGIFRNIYIEAFQQGRITDFYVMQTHKDSEVMLEIQVEKELWAEENLGLCCSVYDPSGKCVCEKKVCGNDLLDAADLHLQLAVKNPKLWWPNGYGEQPLYRVEMELLGADETILQKMEKKIGLRTLTVRKEKDQWGASFYFEINGVDLFARGANYIPEDSLLGRCNKDRTRKLLDTCIDSNFNCIRVWGGGLYAEDYFYDLCDEMGLIVWQDFTFACAVYELTDEFRDNIVKECEDNIRRLRHHASLGIWCGNNEMEVAWKDWGLPQNEKLRLDYLEMFEHVIPEVVRKYDPQRFYWPASPSSVGGFVDPNSDDYGDAHYWGVWHGREPFENFKKHHFRFASEYGFQSFPCMKTIKTFAKPEDYNIYSPVMEAHQKCNSSGNGNAIIMNYMADHYQMPKNFAMTLYASQILQGDCLQMAIEHWRRNRGRCMGSTYWQINDCWPVASWATLDYFGRWKASQYMVKRSYAPIMISADVDGKNGSCTLCGVNDSRLDFSGELHIQILHQNKGLLEEQRVAVTIKERSATEVTTLQVKEGKADKRDLYIRYVLKDENGRTIFEDSVILVEPKKFHWRKPTLQMELKENADSYEFIFTSDVYVRRMGIDFAELDGIFEDNYRDLYPGEKTSFFLLKKKLSKETTAEELKNQMEITSVYDISGE